MITVLLVDDQPAIRRGLRMRLALEPDLLVVGEAGDGKAALALAYTLRPMVILMDIAMPGMDGLAATSALRDLGSRCAVVILSLHDDMPNRLAAAAAGAAAFVAKQGDVQSLLTTIRAAGAPPPSSS